jgi:excisionase family DNA binding protein
MPKWNKPADALVWWFEHVFAARDFGQGCIPPPEDDEMIDQSIENWDYPEWWYTWLDLDRLFTRRFSQQEQRIMSYYLIYVYKGESGAFYRWRENNKFIAIMKKLWKLIPPDYKDYSRIHHARPKKGEIDVSAIDPDKFYTTEEVANILRFTKSAIHSWIRDHGLKAFKTPGKVYHYRILGSDLVNFLTHEGGKDE